MNKMEWKPEYSVNHPILDQQHKKLFKIFNALIDSNSEKGSSEDSEFHYLLNELVEFTREHIKTEDSILLQYGYYCYEEHKKEHADFENELVELVWKACENRSDKIELIEFIYKKWVDHILHSDRDFCSIFE